MGTEDKRSCRLDSRLLLWGFLMTLGDRDEVKRPDGEVKSIGVPGRFARLRWLLRRGLIVGA